MDDPAGLAEWALEVPEEMRTDSLWRLPAYRFSLFLGDLAQLHDAPLVRADYRTRKHLDQLLDAVGSISANIAEGYGRSTGPERAKFYEYGNSSAREARDWYFKVRHALPPGVAGERIALLTRVMKILTVATVRERAEPESRARRASRPAAPPGEETPEGERPAWSRRATQRHPATSTSTR